MAPAPGELTLSFNHTIFYSTEQPVPAHDIAEALLALDRVVQRVPGVLKQLVPGISAPKVQLLVRRLESGSLYEDVVVKFFFGSQKKMDRAIRRVKEALGVDLTTAKGTIRAIFWGIVLVGASWAIGHHLAAPGKPNIEISHNTIINIGAQEMHMKPDDLVKIIEAAVQNKNQAASDAVKIIRPAKADPKAEIILDGQEDIKISREVIVKVPSEFTADKSEDAKTYPHAEVHVRALDLDSSEHGWAATVPQVSPRRLPLEIAGGINPDDLFGKKVVTGTIEAISRRDQYGKMQLKAYRLTALDADAP